MAWIESHQSLLRHRKTNRACLILGISRYELIGHLHVMWWWALDNVPSSGDLGDLRDDEIAAAAEWEGDATAWVGALRDAGFLDVGPEGRRLHDWYDYAGRRFERRRQDRERPASTRRRRPFMRREWERLRRSIRPLILERDGARCRYCGRTDAPLHIDHITPIARGGSNELANLQVLCAPCNRAKGAR